MYICMYVVALSVRKVYKSHARNLYAAVHNVRRTTRLLVVVVMPKFTPEANPTRSGSGR